MKIELKIEEHNALEQFEQSGANYVRVIEKIFAGAINELKDINNIDPKGNMGLQALARQEAVKIMLEVKDMIFPGQVEKKTKPVAPADPGGSKWR
jgi:hypothetical protein